MKTILSTLSKEGTGRLVCIPPILAGASPEMEATFLMRRIPEPYNWRLIIWGESCATNGGSELPPIRTSLPKMRMMVVIDADQELLLVNTIYPHHFNHSFTHEYTYKMITMKMNDHNHWDIIIKKIKIIEVPKN